MKTETETERPAWLAESRKPGFTDASSSSAVSIAAAPARPRILILSSEPHIRRTLGFFLEADDYDLQFAACPEEALTEARQTVPDLILVDARPSGASAIDLCHRLRAEAPLADIPLLLSAPREAVSARQQILELGAADYLPSPVDALELRTRLRALLFARGTLRHPVPVAPPVKAPPFEALGAVALGLGHDLNNILQHVFTASQLLREIATDTASRELVQSIRASAARGATLVTHMLAFARGRAVERECINLQPVVEEVVAAAALSFPKNIQFQLRCESALWDAPANSGQIYGILLNLLVNSRDALPDGGKIQVETANVRLGREQIGNRKLQPGRHIVLRVSDTGRGIPPEIRERIFDLFFTTKSASCGTGLGLAQARDIARNHGGDISVTSETGLGSVFEVFLPCEPRLDPGTPSHASRPSLAIAPAPVVPPVSGAALRF